MDQRKERTDRGGRTPLGVNPRSAEDLVSGKIQPQAVDLEQAVLGAMMLEQSAVNSAIDVLKPESFYKEAHKRIFAVIIDLFQKSEPIDILTVTQALRKAGDIDLVGGPYYVSQLTTRIASTANVEQHARIVAQKYIQRELIRVSNEIMKDAYEETTDVFDLLDHAESSLFQVAEGNIRKSYDTMSNLMREAIIGIDAARENKDGVSGVPSGFVDLDRVTGGWQRSDMVVLAARPGMGKTAFVLSMARNMAVDYGVPVAVFSLEMAGVQLVNRLIASETGLSSEKLRKGTLEDHEYQQLHQRIGKLANAPLFIDDTPAISIFELRAKCRRLKAQHGIDMVVIDYLQLMSGGGDNKGNREQEISSISRSIKSIAKELNVPIIALSQLSRSVETRGGEKRPILSDLRESGAIEQDADIVCFIYRAEYYGFTDPNEHPRGKDPRGLGELIIAKHRNGALETVDLRFIGHLAKFTNYDTFDEDSPFPKGLKPNQDFEGIKTITVSSRMNDDEEDDEVTIDRAGEEPPF
ncbi:MAG: replicative DNA helicase [Flavobacteriales bacterium]|nr:replicative DNA helicase [Flavobacteriales bacterium]MDG2244819.1 replicative DNA helicase [Flavobacteriales bacterium]